MLQVEVAPIWVACQTMEVNPHHRLFVNHYTWRPPCGHFSKHVLRVEVAPIWVACQTTEQTRVTGGGCANLGGLSDDRDTSDTLGYL
ncbi:hypothetical protein J6590_068612 [Homalodisca vitripennis]|nr:hypothetical protein J6590_068612 [Homalodisca vitripennis]